MFEVLLHVCEERIIRVHPRNCCRHTTSRFSIISDPAFTETQTLGRFCERPKENGKNSWRHSQKTNLERAGEETM